MKHSFAEFARHASAGQGTYQFGVLGDHADWRRGYDAPVGEEGQHQPLQHLHNPQQQRPWHINGGREQQQPLRQPASRFMSLWRSANALVSASLHEPAQRCSRHVDSWQRINGPCIAGRDSSYWCLRAFTGRVCFKMTSPTRHYRNFAALNCYRCRGPAEAAALLLMSRPGTAAIISEQACFSAQPVRMHLVRE